MAGRIRPIACVLWLQQYTIRLRYDSRSTPVQRRLERQSNGRRIEVES